MQDSIETYHNARSQTTKIRQNKKLAEKKFLEDIIKYTKGIPDYILRNSSL